MYEKPNPEGYHSVTPSLVIRGAAEAIEFYQRIFAAKVRLRMDMPDGKIMHAEIVLGDSAVMLSEESPAWGTLSPLSLGGSAATINLYVADADAVFAEAVAAGSEVVFPMTTQFWGDRSGKLKDPFGHLWMIATRVEEVSQEEIDQRGQEMMKQMQKGDE